MTRDKLLWCVKQLLPLKYRTYFIENSIHYYTEWCMWFGKCFNIKKWEITKEEYDAKGELPPCFQVIPLG